MSRVLALLIFLDLSPSLALTQATLYNFKIAQCSPKACFQALGAKADSSFLSPLLAAQDVNLKIQWTPSQKKEFHCASFTYDFRHNMITCEVLRKGQVATVLWDPANSQLSIY